MLSEVSREYFHLGTANFGSNYGMINNTVLSLFSTQEILEWGANHFRFLDTAIDYEGSAERIRDYSNKYLVNTKISLLKYEKAKDLATDLMQNLRKLNVEKVDILYIRGNFLNEESQFNEFFKVIQNFKHEGLIKRIGFSIYETSDLEIILEKTIDIDVVQVPCNLVNRSWSEYFERNSEVAKRIEFVARSVFLQGLLLMSEEDLRIAPRKMLATAKALDRISQELKISKLDLCVAYIKSLSWVSGVVIGTNSKTQLVETYNSFADKSVCYHSDWLNLIPRLQPDQVDPRKWETIV